VCAGEQTHACAGALIRRTGNRLGKIGAGNVKNWQLLITIMSIALLSACEAASAGDSAAGQKIFAGSCAACHQLKSYAGKSESELVTELKGIIAGGIKHPKKLTLNDTAVADVAAYISMNEPK
jgi:mono/diheme cytochrome c family protein